MITLEQRNFISVLESKGVEGEHQLPHLKQRFNLTDNQAIQLQNEYWDVIYKEIKQPVKPMTATNKFDTVDNFNRRGEQTINKTAVGMIYKLGQYEGNFDLATLIFKSTLIFLLVGALIWIAGVFILGWRFV